MYWNHRDTELISLFLPSGERVLSSVVRSIVVRIFLRSIDHVSLLHWSVLGIDIHLLSVPHNDFLTVITLTVENLRRERRMAVIGERDDDVALPVHETAIFRVSIEEHQVLTRTVPVHGSDDVAVVYGFPVPDLITLRIMHVYDTVVLPVCGRTDLKTFSLGKVLADAYSLTVSVDISMENPAVRRNQHESLPSRYYCKARFGFIIEPAVDDFIGMVSINRKGPHQGAVMVNHVIAGEEFILTVTVPVVVIREVTRIVLGESPEEIEFGVVEPETRVSVLYEDITRAVLTGDIHDSYGIDIETVEGVAAELETGDGLRVSDIERSVDALLDRKSVV